MNREITPEEEAENGATPSGVVAKGALIVASEHRVVRFRGRPMLLKTAPYAHFVPLHREMFEGIAYPLLGGVTRSRIGDVFAYLSHVAQDLTAHDHLILFGTENGEHKVWDMEKLRFDDESDAAHAIWRSPHTAVLPDDDGPVDFVMSLAGGDQDLYDDIMQSLAPLVMYKKPDGVIWWLGDGANGKSTLMDAVYRIFPGQLSSINVKRLTDGRDTPSLNGTLGNIVKESSEGRIDDTEVYKSIGTHENFRVHKFHSQDDIEILGNVHHIFSANSVPAFNDKGFSARRRTFIVPFTQRFKSDPLFEKRTFTPEMFGRLIAEMCRYAQRIRDQGYRYKWSAITLGAKADYDTEANSAEEYAKTIIAEGVTGFESFLPLRIDYENWCADNGYVPLGMANLRRAVQAAGFERITVREGTNASTKKYKIPTVESNELLAISMSRPGLYTIRDFRPSAAPIRETEPEIQMDFHEPREVEHSESPPPEAENEEIKPKKEYPW